MRVVNTRVKTEEERELERRIVEIMRRHEEECRREIAPLLAQLQELAALFPAQYVLMPE